MYSNKNTVSVAVNGYGLPSDQDRTRILELLASTPPDKLIVFDKSIGPTDNESEYLEWIDNLDMAHEFILVTANYHYHFNKHPKIVHYPSYFFTTLNDRNLIKHNIVDPRPYKISCLNRNPWLHKSLNFVRMSQCPWFDQVQASFGVYYPDILSSPISADLLALITDSEAEYLESIYPMPLQLENDDVDKFESNACPTYQNCYIDYAPESRHDNTFISEKTWKPIFSGQFFFILGPAGIIAYLRDIGIDVFDDLIDHAYDQETELSIKVNMILDSITKFLENDLDQLWIDTLIRREKNLDLVYNPDFQQRMSADLFSRVS
jgi:hypothetical protein